MIRIGNWIQGIIQEGNSIHVIRSWYNENLQQWCNLIEYGNSDAFPIQFNGDIDDVVKVRNGWKWKCIERNSLFAYLYIYSLESKNLRIYTAIKCKHQLCFK